MLKKILLGLVALFFILAGSLVLLMGYVFNNPESVFKVFNSVTDKILQGQEYEENEEYFLQGIETLQLASRQVDAEIYFHKGNTLKVSLRGKVPRYENGPFISQNNETSHLNIQLREPLASGWIHMNVNGEEMTQESNSDLKATVYIPESYRGHVNIETTQGHVLIHLPSDGLYETDLQSVSGKIENKVGVNEKPTSPINPNEVGHIKVRTKEGSITIEPSP